MYILLFKLIGKSILNLIQSINLFVDELVNFLTLIGRYWLSLGNKGYCFVLLLKLIWHIQLNMFYVARRPSTQNVSILYC